MPEKRKYSDRAEYIKKAVTLSRQRCKIKAVNYKGGKCQHCGYNKSVKAMQFHHLDPKEKDFAISKYSKSWETIVTELDKCILLCANCHAEEHEKIYSSVAQ